MGNDKLQLYMEGASPPVIHASGELDYENCSGLDSMIREALDKCDSSLNLALGGLSFIDSSGLRILVKAALDGKKLGCNLNIISMTPHLDRMLDVSGFRHLFTISLPTLEATAQPPAPKMAAGPEMFVVAANTEACREARDHVRGYAAAMGFDQLALDDIKLAIGEAVSNAVRHGACQGGPIGISCRNDDDRLIVTFRYPSDVFDPHSIPIPTCETASEGGMGIYFMRLVMDRVHYEFIKGHTVLTLEKRLAA